MFKSKLKEEEKPFNILTPNVVHEPDELTLPYKNFHDYVEGLFRLNKNKEFQKEKDKNFSFKINGGDGNNNEIAENQDDITNIKNFLLYNMNSDLKIRIEL